VSGRYLSCVVTGTGRNGRESASSASPWRLRICHGIPASLRTGIPQLLRAADHVRDTKTTAGGTEWFETSTEFLDAIAQVLGLEKLDLGENDLG
jgi:hypothetical protein